jgi:uncharacterized protein YjdB
MKKTTSIFLLFVFLICSFESKAQERIIFDSDMSSDHDDAADMAVLNALADLGECEILACMASSQNGATALAFNSINTYFGRPDVPCGRRPDCGGLGMFPATIQSEWPHPLYNTYLDPPLCVNLYREVLASQPDHSVTIVTTGYLNNLEALMKSVPDEYSSLNGMDLIRQKVKLLACAGGCYPSGDEFNFRVEPSAAYYVINNWPTSAFFDGYDVGQDIYSAWDLERTGTFNPIRRAFELTFFGAYPTWGQLMIYYAVRTAESQSLWHYNTTGHNNCDASGHNWWSTETDPTDILEQGYMIEIQRYPIQEAINTLVMNSGAPKSRGTVSPPNKPSNLRGTAVGSDRIDLQWTDNSWNETGFTIERQINNTFTEIATVGAGATSYSDTGLSTTHNINYRLKSNNAIGSSTDASLSVYSGGWTEYNLTNTSDHSPIYNYYQNNLNWARGANVVGHRVLNNDSQHGQDLTVNVLVGAQGGYGRFYIYFFYQDANNWYRVNTGSIGQGQANYSSKFEKCINGIITQIGTTGEGVNISNGSFMETWQLVVSHAGIIQFFTNDNKTGIAYSTMHQVLNATDNLSFSGGKIGLGSDGGQPVWDNFSFDTTPTTNVPVTGINVSPISATINANETRQLTATVVPYNVTNPGINWNSSNSSVATVNESGLVTGVAAGSATITATTQDGEKIATCTFIITPGLCPKLTGTIIGTTDDGSNTKTKAFDGNITNYSENLTSGAWAGLDLGASNKINLIRYIPRSDWSGRMVGGKFQGSNVADFSSGVVDLYTVTANPTLIWNQVTITNSGSFRYVRYLTPPNGYLNVAEIEFYSCTNATGLIENQTTTVYFYPNPTTDRIYFSENVSEVGLFSLQGQQIMTARNISSLDVKLLSKGLYIVRMTDTLRNQKSAKLEIR